MVVISADIRKSTFLMQESIDFVQFAKDLGTFVDRSRNSIREHMGWFDKFTGDGFLAYWIFEPDDDEFSMEQVLKRHVLPGCALFMHMFNAHMLPEFAKNVHNLPASVGLSIGIDAGPTYLVKMGADFTIVGPTVVGVVRMVDAANTPGEVVLNIHPGNVLVGFDPRQFPDWLVRVKREVRPTKEYREGQSVVVLELADSHEVERQDGGRDR